MPAPTNYKVYISNPQNVNINVPDSGYFDLNEIFSAQTGVGSFTQTRTFFKADSLDLSGIFHKSTSENDRINFATNFLVKVGETYVDLQDIFRRFGFEGVMAFLVNPQNIDIIEGQTVAFTAKGSGVDPISYQWYLSGITQADFSSLGSNFGAQTTGYSKPNSLYLNDQGFYKCYAQNIEASGFSQIAYANIKFSPKIWDQPDSIAVNEGDSPTFGIEASGNPSGASLTFQWKKNVAGTVSNITTSEGGLYQNFTTKTLQIANAPRTIHNYGYICEATNTIGSSGSNSGVVSVYYPSTVLAQPSDITGIENQNDLIFSTAADGRSDASFYWQKLQNGTWTNLSNGAKYNGAQGPVLEIDDLQVADTGFYRCYILNYKADNVSYWETGTRQARLDVAYLQITGGTITTNQYLLSVGDLVNYTVLTRSNPPVNSYQWKWDGANYSTDPVLSFEIQNETNSGVYSVFLSNGYVSNVTEDSTLYIQPYIKNNNKPFDIVVDSGDSATFESDAGGSSLSYTWQQSTNGGSTWSNIESSNSFEYIIFSALKSQNKYKYRPIISNSLNIEGYPTIPATGRAATLTVAFPATIDYLTPFPNLIMNKAGFGTSDDLFIFLSESGSPTTTFSWEESTNGGSSWGLAGSSTDKLTLTNAGNNYIGFAYRCVVGNTRGANVTGGPIYVYVDPNIVIQPQNVSVLENTTASFALLANGSPTLSYQWYSGAGAPLSSVAGATNSGYSFTALRGDDGNEYQCVVSSSFAGMTADLSNVVTLTVEYIPSFDLQPTNQFVKRGSVATFESLAQGKPSPSYLWYYAPPGSSSFTPVPSNGSLSNYSVTVEPSNKNYQYRVSGYNARGAALSNIATLYMNPTIVTDLPASVSAQVGNGQNNTVINFYVSGDSSPTLQYQWQENAGAGWQNFAGTNSPNFYHTVDENDSGVSIRCEISSTQAGTEAEQSSACEMTVTLLPITITQFLGNGVSNPTVNEGASVSYVTTAVGAGTLGYDFYLRTYPGGTPTDTLLQSSAANTYTFNASKNDNGKEYFCAVDSSKVSLPVQNSTISTLTVYYAPVITDDPDSVYLNVTDQAVFSVAADAGNPSTFYKWEVNDGSAWSVIGGATSSSYSVTTSNAIKNYQYRCIVGNNSSFTLTDTSAAATLYVNPNITDHPDSTSVNEGGNATFTVVADGSGPLHYTWYRNGSEIDGAADSNSFTQVGVTYAGNNGDTYYCVVSTEVSAFEATSNTATLTVIAAPAPAPAAPAPAPAAPAPAPSAPAPAAPAPAPAAPEPAPAAPAPAPAAPEPAPAAPEPAPAAPEPAPAAPAPAPAAPEPAPAAPEPAPAAPEPEPAAPEPEPAAPEPEPAAPEPEPAAPEPEPAAPEPEPAAPEPEPAAPEPEPAAPEPEPAPPQEEE